MLSAPNPVKILYVSPSKSSTQQSVHYKNISNKPRDLTRPDLTKFKHEIERLTKKFPNSLYTCSSIADKKIALTFDDGPDSQTTPKILDILDSHNILATFFVIGKNIDKHSQAINKIVDRGHQLANHSWSHLRPTSISTYELLSEIEKTQQKLQEKGINTFYFRPPYGLVTDEQMKSLESKGYMVIIWSIDSLDWYLQDAKEIENCVLEAIHPGAIVLMHCAGGIGNRKATVQALPYIITKLKKIGYKFVTVEELLNS
jgi:peptidoglycan/xylan/chitin deacetylase (PgdA/CDA1 family)